MPPRHSRRGFVIGGLLTGAALAVGAAGVFTMLSRHPGPLPHAVTPNPVPVPAAPDVMFGLDAQHTRFNSAETILNPTNVSSLMPAWLSGPLGRNYFSSPVVSGGVLYVGTADGLVHALDAATGQARWTSEPQPHSSPSDANDSTPAVVNGVVYMCLDRKLYAFDAVTGQFRWVSQTSAALASSPTVVNGVVYMTGSDTVFAFDAATGQLRWSSSSGTNAPALANSLLYVVTWGKSAGTGRISALEAATGKVRWTSDLIDGGVDTNSSPTVANGLLYIGAGNGGVVAFDAATGRTRWVTARTAGSTGCSPAVAHGMVYLANDRLFAFDAASGQPRWASDRIGAYNSDSPLVANGVIYVGSAGHDGVYLGSVYALDATTGRTLWVSAPTEGQIFTTPAVANGFVYIASGDQDGKVYAFSLPRPTS